MEKVWQSRGNEDLSLRGSLIEPLPSANQRSIKEFSDPSALLLRQNAFWLRKSIERPLIGLYKSSLFSPDIYRVAAEGEVLHPHELKAERFFDLFRNRSLELNEYDQDLIRPPEPLNCVPWLEGILGMQLRVFQESVWAEPLLGEREPLDGFQPGRSDEWLKATLQFISDLVHHFSPSSPVAGPFLRGPADIVAAMIGTRRLCFELIDNPMQIERLTRICAEAWIQVSREVIRHIPAWHGGYIPGARWIHAPGECVYSSEDATVLISPKMYRDIFLPYNLEMISHFPFGFIHRHSASLQNIACLVDLPENWAIEVTIDPLGPAIKDLLPVLLKVQESAHPLILFGFNTIQQGIELLQYLAPQGLCLIPMADTPDQAKTLLSTLHTYMPVSQVDREDHD